MHLQPNSLNTLRQSSTLRSLLSAKGLPVNQFNSVSTIEPLWFLPDGNKLSVSHNQHANDATKRLDLPSNNFNCDNQNLLLSQICGKNFGKGHNLSVHLRLHGDIRPFKCHQCQACFRQKAHLNRHLTTHQGQQRLVKQETIGEVSTPAGSTIQAAGDNKGSMQQCQQCSRCFVSSLAFKIHLKEHGDLEVGNLKDFKSESTSVEVNPTPANHPDAAVGLEVEAPLIDKGSSQDLDSNTEVRATAIEQVKENPESQMFNPVQVNTTNCGASNGGKSMTVLKLKDDDEVGINDGIQVKPGDLKKGSETENASVEVAASTWKTVDPTSIGSNPIRLGQEATKALEGVKRFLFKPEIKPQGTQSVLVPTAYKILRQVALDNYSLADLKGPKLRCPFPFPGRQKCWFECRSQLKLNFHLMVRHLYLKLFSCSVCSESFEDAVQLNKHIASHVWFRNDPKSNDRTFITVVQRVSDQNSSALSKIILAGNNQNGQVSSNYNPGLLGYNVNSDNNNSNDNSTVASSKRQARKRVKALKPSAAPQKTSGKYVRSAANTSNYSNIPMSNPELVQEEVQANIGDQSSADTKHSSSANNNHSSSATSEEHTADNKDQVIENNDVTRKAKSDHCDDQIDPNVETKLNGIENTKTSANSSDGPELKCLICSHTFPDNVSLKNHVAIHRWNAVHVSLEPSIVPADSRGLKDPDESSEKSAELRKTDEKETEEEERVKSPGPEARTSSPEKRLESENTFQNPVPSEQLEDQPTVADPEGVEPATSDVTLSEEDRFVTGPKNRNLFLNKKVEEKPVVSLVREVKKEVAEAPRRARSKSSSRTAGRKEMVVRIRKLNLDDWFQCYACKSYFWEWSSYDNHRRGCDWDDNKDAIVVKSERRSSTSSLSSLSSTITLSSSSESSPVKSYVTPPTRKKRLTKFKAKASLASKCSKTYSRKRIKTPEKSKPQTLGNKRPRLSEKETQAHGLEVDSELTEPKLEPVVAENGTICQICQAVLSCHDDMVSHLYETHLI